MTTRVPAGAAASRRSPGRRGAERRAGGYGRQPADVQGTREPLRTRTCSRWSAPPRAAWASTSSCTWTTPRPPTASRTADYDKLRSDFDTLLYAADTAAFGRESDIDGNGRVIVLMTNVVNRLVTSQQCITTAATSRDFSSRPISPPARARCGTTAKCSTRWWRTRLGRLSCAHSVAPGESCGPRDVHPRVSAHDQLQPARRWCAAALRRSCG